MRMRLEHAVAMNPTTEQGSRDELPQRSDTAPDDQLEIRIKNLERLANSIQAALGRQSFSGKHQALGLANDLRLKIAANWKMFQVARLLREPARESMLSRVRSSVDDLEESIATHFGVEMT
jgi:hypothetical protein